MEYQEGRYIELDRDPDDNSNLEYVYGHVTIEKVVEALTGYCIHADDIVSLTYTYARWGKGNDDYDRILSIAKRVTPNTFKVTECRVRS